MVRPGHPEEATKRCLVGRAMTYADFLSLWIIVGMVVVALRPGGERG